VGAVPALVRRVGQRVGAGRQRHGSPRSRPKLLQHSAMDGAGILDSWKIGNLLGDGYI
jgi:hypothetical protein